MFVQSDTDIQSQIIGQMLQCARDVMRQITEIGIFLEYVISQNAILY